MSYKLMVGSLQGFINKGAFSNLRPSDRREFADFGDRLLQGDATRSRMDCEGLDKYLDSLAVVSQRDVLLKHDALVREAITEGLEAALSLADSQPSMTAEMIKDAFERAEQLFGLSDELDSLVFKWSTLPEAKRDNLQGAVEMGRMLKELAQPRR
jgi:hypothetical protein